MMSFLSLERPVMLRRAFSPSPDAKLSQLRTVPALRNAVFDQVTIPNASGYVVTSGKKTKLGQFLSTCMAPDDATVWMDACVQCLYVVCMYSAANTRPSAAPAATATSRTIFSNAPSTSPSLISSEPISHPSPSGPAIAFSPTLRSASGALSFLWVRRGRGRLCTCTAAGTYVVRMYGSRIYRCVYVAITCCSKALRLGI